MSLRLAHIVSATPPSTASLPLRLLKPTYLFATPLLYQSKPLPFSGQKQRDLPFLEVVILPVVWRSGEEDVGLSCEMTEALWKMECWKLGRLVVEPNFPCRILEGEGLYTHIYTFFIFNILIISDTRF